MPRMRQLTKPNLTGYTKAPNPLPSAARGGASPTLPNPNGRSSMMLAAMPLAASTNDALARQFYGGANVPRYRILPAAGSTP